MNKDATLTDGRLASEPTSALIKHALAPLLKSELTLFDAFLQVDMAHTVMLAEANILKPVEVSEILSCLSELRKRGVGALDVDPKRGSFLVQVERYLSDRIGSDTAGRLHTARSRNDQSAAANRLHVRDRLIEILNDLIDCQGTLLSLAERYADALMPGYTHMQRAQPTTLGHQLLRFVDTFERDQQRLEGAFSRTNLSALGGAALVGTTWPISRDRTAELLGHEGIVENATDAGIFARDYPAENAAALSIMVCNVGRLAGDLYLWSSHEFGMVEISDSLAGTSSIMPQKKNPHCLERLRGIAGSAVGWLPAVLGTLRSVSSTDLELHFAPDPVIEMLGSSRSCLAMLDEAMRSLVVHRDVMARAVVDDWSTANNLADALVRYLNMPFRRAHQVVGRLVRNTIDGRRGPTSVNRADLETAIMEMTGERFDMDESALLRALDPETYVAALTTVGSANPDHVRTSVVQAAKTQELHASWHKARVEAIAKAKDELGRAVHHWIQTGSRGERRKE